MIESVKSTSGIGQTSVQTYSTERVCKSDRGYKVDKIIYTVVMYDFDGIIHSYTNTRSIDYLI